MMPTQTGACLYALRHERLLQAPAFRLPLSVLPFLLAACPSAGVAQCLRYAAGDVAAITRYATPRSAAPAPPVLRSRQWCAPAAKQRRYVFALLR